MSLSRFAPCPALLLCGGLLGGGTAAFGAGTVEEVREQAAPLRAKYREALTDFAQQAETAGLPEYAAALRERASPPDSALLSVTPPPRAVREALPVADRSPETTLRRADRRVGEAYANAMFLLAKKAATKGAEEPGAAATAIGLLWEAVAADPDHVGCRRALGQTRDGDDWLTPWERAQARRGRVDHPTFGWVPKRHVAKLEAGERLLDGKWVAADRAELLRADFANGWVCETEHYEVRTNVSLERGAEVARQLERFHTFFRAAFPGFGLGPVDLRKRFSSFGAVPVYNNAGGADGNYHVHLYRDKAEYVLALQADVPQIEVSNGFYYNGYRVAYFYEIGQGAAPETVFHEATHQLFYECAPRQRYVAEEEHFWAVEGIGCYMESFRDDGETMTAGRPRYQRFRNAKRRWVEDGFYVPLAEFDARSRISFQTDPEVSKCYSQASGLTHFLMHAGDGALRPAFVAHLTELYHPQVRPRDVRSVATLAGVPWEDLGAAYQRYIAALPVR